MFIFSVFICCCFVTRNTNTNGSTDDEARCKFSHQTCKFGRCEGVCLHCMVLEVCSTGSFFQYFNPAFVGYKKGSLTYKIDVFSISEGSKGFLGDLLGPPVSPDKYRE